MGPGVMRVMIADDDRDVAGVLAALVEACGHEVVATVLDGGRAVIQEYSERRPDCVLMDVLMPQFNGLTVCHAILSKDPAAKIILVSGQLSADHPFVRDANPAAFLSKPVRQADLQRTLDDLHASLLAA